MKNIINIMLIISISLFFTGCYDTYTPIKIKLRDIADKIENKEHQKLFYECIDYNDKAIESTDMSSAQLVFFASIVQGCYLEKRIELLEDKILDDKILKDKE